MKHSFSLLIFPGLFLVLSASPPVCKKISRVISLHGVISYWMNNHLTFLPVVLRRRVNLGLARWSRQKENKLADQPVHTNFPWCYVKSVCNYVFKIKSASRQLKQCQLRFVCVSRERGWQRYLFIYIFCLQPVRAACKEVRLWKVAWFSVCKLINYGYCQGNVWAMCYNEHSETHQHSPTGCHSTRL